MTHTVEYLEGEGIVLTTFTGELTAKLAIEMYSEEYRTGLARNCNLFLTDLSQAQVAMGIMDLYGTPAVFEKIGFSRQMRRAVAYPGNHTDMGFFENVLCNRGWRVSVFKTMKSARAWLLQQ